MTEENLTRNQLAFLEECSLEFSERYTDADVEYKKIYELGIPPPPIVYPYYGKGRDRRGGGRFNDYRNRNRDDRTEDNRRHRDYGYREGYREQPGSSYNNHQSKERMNYNYENSRNRSRSDHYRPY